MNDNYPRSRGDLRRPSATRTVPIVGEVGDGGVVRFYSPRTSARRPALRLVKDAGGEA